MEFLKCGKKSKICDTYSEMEFLKCGKKSKICHTYSAMEFLVIAVILSALLSGAFAIPGGVPGMDVSSHQGAVNWKTAYANGARFAYVKATEGASYTNPYFAQQYVGSYNVGMIRGAYHFARPDTSGGASQASFFLAHGGRWSSDGLTLPGALDIEYNPSCGSSCTRAQKCYNLSQASMAAWIRAFVDTYKSSTGVYPVIYTTTDWYTTCVGTYGDFSATCPLWIAAYRSNVGSFPYKWSYYTFWQYADSGKFPGDQNVFNGPYTQLQKLAKGP